jgi:hypothetical protein
MPGASASGWPLVGRDNEVRQALVALEDDAEFQGVALSAIAVSANRHWLAPLPRLPSRGG